MLGMKNVYHHHIDRAKVGIKPQRGMLTLFRHDTPDDEWMEYVGAKGWIVISQDYSFHLEPSVLSVIKQHRVKVFYLWGASDPKREVMRVFLNNHTKIIATASANDGPYVFRIKQRGPLQRYM
jgi:PIN like domain